MKALRVLEISGKVIEKSYSMGPIWPSIFGRKETAERDPR